MGNGRRVCVCRLALSAEGDGAGHVYAGRLSSGNEPLQRDRRASLNGLG